MVSELRLRSSLFASAAFSLTDTMAEAGAASAEAETRAKSIQEKAMLFAKDGMVPPARNRDELCKAMNPCAEVVQQFGLTPEAGVEVMYRVLAALEVERDGPLPASDVVALVNHAMRRAKDQPGATGTDGVGMATDEEREQALQSAFTDSDRVLAILTAAAAVEYKNAAAAAAPVRKSGGTKLGAKSTAAADTEMHGTESGQQDENVRQTEKEPQTEVEKPNDESDIDSETEGHLLARLAVVFKDKPRAFSAAVRRQFGGTTKASDSQPRRAVGRSKPIESFYGKPSEMGRDAKDWLSSVEIYLDSVVEKEPVRLVATHLRGDALTWWIQGGKEQIGLTAPFADFADAFLARFVKPGDNRKAKHELSAMQQDDMSVESFAAKFKGCAKRIAVSKVGTAVDSTTQAEYFLSGLKKTIVNKLQGTVSPDVMQDIDKLIDAAETGEANLDMSARQGQERPKSKDEKGHGRSQANQVSRGRGNRFQRFTPYGAGGRGFGRGFASNNAVQALPPQEVQFNYAQADYGYNNNVEAPPQQYGAPRHCYNCGGIGHYAAACRGRGQNPARGRGPSRVSLYSDAFGTHAGQRLERLFGCKPDRHEALSCDHDECAERDSGSDEFEYVGKKKKKVRVISGSLLRSPPGFDSPQYTVAFSRIPMR